MTHTHLALALDGAGWHPAAWREPGAEPDRLFDPRRWVALVQEAERGLLDLVTIEDSLALQDKSFFGEGEERADRVLGRLDAVLLAARIGPLTRNIGIVPTATVTHTEPFHISKEIATLDFVTGGRAGWRVQVSGRPAEAANFGRREIPALEPRPDGGLPDDDRTRALLTDLFDEAADAVEVVRRLWDSWEDDAEIRDAATGRFVDVDRLHYVDFAGRFFSVKGPSITPRPPQGQPLVTALAHSTIPYRLGARSADVLWVTPRTDDEVRSILAEVRAEEAAVTTRPAPLKVWGDLVVFLDDDPARAHDRKAALDEKDGAELTSDTRIVVGSPTEVADLIEAWAALGLEGFRLRPGAIPHDVEAVTRGLVPELQRRGLFRTSYEATTLRGLLGLDRPESRYVADRLARAR